MELKPKKTYVKRKTLLPRRRKPNSLGEYTYDRTKSNEKLGSLTKIERAKHLYPQAANVIDKFGGHKVLLDAINALLPEGEKPWVLSTIHRWTYPVEVQGTGGHIPTRKIPIVLKAARYFGVLITIDDLYPILFDTFKEKDKEPETLKVPDPKALAK